MSEKGVIGVVGLGVMGLGIAQVFAAAGFRVLAEDTQDAARTAALPRIRADLDARVSAGRMTTADSAALLARIGIADTLQGLAGTDMVVEAIAETLPAKRALLRMLEGVTGPDVILASNTSSLRIGAMAEGLAHPDRVLGLHFFNPAPAMKLVELVAHPGTSATALANARAMTLAAGKTVIDAPDRPGFIVNRCARPFYGEALALLEEGRSASEIDAAMLAAGYRIGPLSLIDLIGADINLAATEGVWTAMGHHPRYHPFDALRAQAASGRLGRKTGRGFLFPDRPGPAPPDAAAIADRIEAALVNEAASLLAEGGVTVQAIDTGMMLGLNFPRGPSGMAARIGRDRIAAILSRLEAAAPEHLKGRYVAAGELE
jgi:3-hydroxybutyryl-CoA dehydrogenase